MRELPSARRRSYRRATWRGAVMVLAGALLSASLTPAVASAKIVASVQDTVAQDPQNVAAVAAEAVVGFRPGNIISDEVFFNSGTMSEADIQRFLEARVPTCRAGYTCLKDYWSASSDRERDPMCSGYSGAASESAARIIFRVAQSCGINPQVLLVTLQKEQSLVTDTWPLASQYRIAMGQACPDTAPCDSRYYGFFNQVYGAASQFKRYANPPGTSRYFTWYAPGKTWNVRYSPDASCGTSPVYIENQATANLYYYTPYQPNAASLRAGDGIGDGCSSYGNRNFFRFFTQWFGSTQVSNTVLVRTEADPTVYLIDGERRWSVPSFEDFVELNAVYGPTYVVSDAYVAGKRAAGPTGAILRNATTGVISLIQGGQRHAFATCDQLARWGGSCSRNVDVSAAIADRATLGAGVTDYFRVRGGGWGRLDGVGSATMLWDEAAARAVAGTATAPAAMYLGSDVYASLTRAPMLFAPAQLVRSTEKDQVYLTTEFNGLLRVGQWVDITEYGRDPGSTAVVSQAELDARYSVKGDVAPLVTCGGQTYMVAGGVLHPLAGDSGAGLSIVEIGATTCAQFSKDPAVARVLALRTASAPWVYLVVGGTRQLVPTWNDLVSRSGGSPVTMTVDATTLQRIRVVAPDVDGRVVKADGQPALSVVSDGVRYQVPSFDLAGDVGFAMDYVTIPTSDADLLGTGQTLGLWVSCGGKIRFGAGGSLRPVAAAAAAGFTPIVLDEASCARFSLAKDAELKSIFVKTKTSPTVYIATGGKYRAIASWSELISLAGGVVPQILTLSDSTLAGLPRV